MDIERYMGVLIALLVALAGVAVAALAVSATSLLWTGIGLVLVAMGTWLGIREWRLAQVPRSPFTGRPVRHPQVREVREQRWPENSENPRR